ncbi:hypothetical protein ACHAXT_004058 [Thalassiosira profunda]
MEMWGDAEGAYSLKPSDPLAKSLLQISGPDPIPYNDARWQQLLLQYERLVHLHNLGLAPQSSSASLVEEDVVGTACRQCAANCSASSNLAAFCLHVSRMVRDLQSSLDVYSTSTEGTDPPSRGSLVKRRISLVGKARVTCGAINLLRILSHETIVQACGSADMGGDCNAFLKEAFTYRNRGEVSGNVEGQDAAMEMIAAILGLLSAIGLAAQQGSDVNFMEIPELYDVVAQILSFLLVLLSTQLYLPMESSAELVAQGHQSRHFFLEKIMEYSRWQGARSRELWKNREERMRQQQAHSLGQENGGEDGRLHNEPLLFINVCLHWLVSRPSPPRRSIASHYTELPKSIAHQMTMAMAADGMYESHSIQHASAPQMGEAKASSTIAGRAAVHLGEPSKDAGSAPHTTTSIALGTDDAVDLSSPGHVGGDVSSWNATPSSMILHPIRSILILSSTFFLLPIRLVRLAFNLLGHSRYHALTSGSSHLKDIADGDQVILQQIQAHCEKNSGWNRTNNILWLTDSPLADMGSALLLLLTNNCRYGPQHPFREELALLKDNRWADESKKTEDTGSSLFPLSPDTDDQVMALSVNFDSLFEALGRVAHTEVGSLSLYSMLLSSPAFATSVSARSDLDKVVVPLLRSLYFASTITHGQPKSAAKSGQFSQLMTLAPNNRPFRSQSQLYVTLILLLIFSQDTSFGRDSFRRVHVAATSVKWYKEKRIKETTLGSMLLLVLLRAVSFNLNRLQDAFLLSNCCAVLLNLSPHISDIGEYAANRLVSVTSSCFKRYTQLVAECGGTEPEEGDYSSLVGMHGETCRTLLTLIKHAIRRKCLEKNIHLVYSLLLEQNDLQNMHQFASLGDVAPISAITERANAVVEENGDGKSADRTMEALKQHVSKLKAYYNPDGLVSDADSVASDASDLGNLTFTYEEEADPEVFFVPYVWDVTVGTLTTTTMEWSRNKIRVFPLNEEVNEPLTQTTDTEGLEGIDEGSHDMDNTPDVV